MTSTNTDCCSQNGLISFESAKREILSRTSASNRTETIALQSAFGRVLAKPIISPINVPQNDNSAMDGYAVRSSDFPSTKEFELIGKSMAGAPFEGSLNKGQCVRIMTGAAIPEGADAVIMQEKSSCSGIAQIGQEISFTIDQVDPGNNCRRAGEDIQKGERIFDSGTPINATRHGVLASLGMNNIEVFNRIKVAVFSSGDELTPPGEKLKTGSIYDSNRFATQAALNNLPIEIIDLGILPDDQNQVKETLDKVSKSADVIITSGGVSVGEADYIKSVVESLGKLALWKIAIKPGKPFAFGSINNAVFIGLPGNPVSSFVTLLLLGIPVIKKLCGIKALEPPRLRAKLATPIRKSLGRKEFQRGKYKLNHENELIVESTGHQGSGVMTSLSQANCLIELADNIGEFKAGEMVTILPLNELSSLSYSS